MRLAAASLVSALTLAFTVGPLGPSPASASFFDFAPSGAMIQQPLPPQFGCAMNRALANRQLPCR